MIKVTLEFPTIEAAIATLGKIMGAAPKLPKESAATAMASRQTVTDGPGVTDPSKVAERAANSTSTVSGSQSAAADLKPRQRAQRSDKGQPRGSYKNAGAELASKGSVSPGGDQARTPAPETAAPSPSENTGLPPADGAVTQAAGSAAAVPTEAEVQKAIEAAHSRTNTQTMMDLFARYGVRRGREIAPDQRAAFIRECEGLGAAK